MIRGKYLTSHDDLNPIYALREKVFREEQGFGPESVRDGHDDMAVYALAYDAEDRPAGTGRLYIDEDDRFVIGCVCVLKENRGQGLGDLIMRMLLYRALDLNAPAVWVEAQLHAVPFYARYGLKPVGAPHPLENGAPHQLLKAECGEVNLEGKCRKSPNPCQGCQGDCAACANQRPET